MDQLRYAHLLQRARRRERVFRDRLNPFDSYDDIDFVCRYRLRKRTVRIIIDRVEDEIISKYGYSRPSDLTPPQQVFLFLRFAATGSFQRVVGDMGGISVPAACVTINRVARTLATQKAAYIQFPQREEYPDLKEDFYRIAMFPNVIGAIDCTHIKIANPGAEDGGRFINRKGVFSINTQVICDAKMRIRNIVARWPGSVHDSRIFDNSRIKEQLSGIPQRPKAYILGDSGYACLPYLMTPFRNPVTVAENQYNRCHKTTRNLIERLFGVWKRRFPCIHYGLRLNLNNSLTMIIAVAILHNIAISEHEPELHDVDLEEDDDSEDNESSSDEEEQEDEEEVDHVMGNAVRNALVQQHFNW